jgi:hypothetical protein
MWLRLRQVALVAAELSPVLDDLHAVFGLEVAFRDPGVGTFGLENAVLPVGQQFIEVVAPVKPDTAAGRQLDRRGGDGGYMVITHTDEHPRRRERVAELGVRTVLEFEESDYRCMQLHPRDTGGSFLEIDWQRGGEDLGGPWAPAGPDWQQAARTDVVSGITAVEVQAERPDEVAARWSEIVEIDLDGGGDGDSVRRLPFDNAEVRFVAATDGRGEGLSGVELVAVDPDAARAAAKERGLLDGDIITICGTRFSFGAGNA